MPARVNIPQVRRTVLLTTMADGTQFAYEIESPTIETSWEMDSGSMEFGPNREGMGLRFGRPSPARATVTIHGVMRAIVMGPE